MTREELQETFKKYFASISVDPVQNFDSTFEEIGMDSLDKLEMSFDFEEAHDVIICSDDLHQCETINQFFEFVEGLDK